MERETRDLASLHEKVPKGTFFPKGKGLALLAKKEALKGGGIRALSGRKGEKSLLRNPVHDVSEESSSPLARIFNKKEGRCAPLPEEKGEGLQGEEKLFSGTGGVLSSLLSRRRGITEGKGKEVSYIFFLSNKGEMGRFPISFSG